MLKIMELKEKYPYLEVETEMAALTERLEIV